MEVPASARAGDGALTQVLVSRGAVFPMIGKIHSAFSNHWKIGLCIATEVARDPNFRRHEFFMRGPVPQVPNVPCWAPAQLSGRWGAL